MNSYCFLCGGKPSVLSEKVAAILKGKVMPMRIVFFANGEKQIRLPVSVSSLNVFLFPAEGESAIWDTLQMIDAVKRSGPLSITVVWPCYPYARQEQAPEGGSIPPQLLSRLLATAGADRLCTIDLHAPGQLKHFALPTKNLSLLPLFMNTMQTMAEKRAEEPVLFAADGSAKARVQWLAEQLNWQFGFAEKRRLPDGTLRLVSFNGEVQNGSVFLIDDRIDSGGTFELVIRRLKKAGVRTIIGWVTHGVCDLNVLDRLQQAGLDRLIETDTRNVTKKDGFVTILSASSCLAEAIRGYREEKFLKPMRRSWIK